MNHDVYHVIPNGDLIEHSSSIQCECDPRRDVESGVIVHNALDNREFDEIAEDFNEDYD